MRKAIIAGLLIAISIWHPVFALGTNTKDHDRPQGLLWSFHIDNELKDGWFNTEMRIVEDGSSNQYYIQVYSRLTGVEEQKLVCYWMFHETAEPVGEIAQTRRINFHWLWFASTNDSRKEWFEKGSKPGPVSILRSMSPFDRTIMMLDIKDKMMVNILSLPEHTTPWIIDDLDKSGTYELVCADRSWAGKYDTSYVPSALVVYSMKNGKFVDSTSDYPEVTKQWDDALAKTVSESKDDFRTQFCISLAQSLKTHGHKDPMSIVEPLLKDSAGYTNDENKQRATRELENIRSMLSER